MAVTVTWAAAASATSYTVAYGTAPGSHPTTVSASASPKTITGLLNGTPYYVVVRASNGSGTGPDSAEVAATPTGGSTGVFYEGFSGTSLPIGWTTTDLSSGANTVSWQVGTNNHGTAPVTSGEPYLFADSWDTGEKLHARVETPSISLPAGSTTLSFVSNYFPFTGQTVDVQIDPGSGWVSLPSGSAIASGTTTPSFDLSAYASQSVRLGFVYGGDNDTYWLIDDVTVQ